MTDAFRRLARDGRCAVNGWIAVSSAYAVETLALLGWDTMLLDLQHGALDEREAFAVIGAVRAAGLPVFVRTRALDPAQLGRALDMGAAGVIAPMVDDAEQAAALVRACRYPPGGDRSFGPLRASAEPVVIAMVETARALAGIDAICSTPGLDAVYIGGADLSVSLGHPARIDYRDPHLAEATQAIIAAAAPHGVGVGVHVVDPADLPVVLAWEPSLVTLGSDLLLLKDAATRFIAAARQGGPS